MFKHQKLQPRNKHSRRRPSYWAIVGPTEKQSLHELKHITAQYRLDGGAMSVIHRQASTERRLILVIGKADVWLSLSNQWCTAVILVMVCPQKNTMVGKTLKLCGLIIIHGTPSFSAICRRWLDVPMEAWKISICCSISKCCSRINRCNLINTSSYLQY